MTVLDVVLVQKQSTASFCVCVPTTLLLGVFSCGGLAYTKYIGDSPGVLALRSEFPDAVLNEIWSNNGHDSPKIKQSV